MKKADKDKLSCRTEIRTTMALNHKIEENAEKMGMGKAQYIIRCIENQPAIPVFVWESDDLTNIMDSLIQVSESIRRLTTGITMVGSATTKDITKLNTQVQELSSLYSDLLFQYEKQRESTTKTARRMVREWKKSERDNS